MEIQSVNVCGGGLMGMGIGQHLAQQGCPVTVMDQDPAALQRGLARVRENLEGQVQRGRMDSVAMEAALSRIATTTSLEAIVDADMIIEAVVENIDVKKDLFRQLDRLCPERTILATNTSILSPTEMGAATNRPERTIGMHWMNPAPIMRLIEVTAGQETSEETLQTVMEYSRRINKVPVRVNEAPGGIVSRVLNAMRGVAVDILAEGVATAEDIDTAMKLGAGFPMGPFELLDLVGVDLAVINADRLWSELGDKYRPNPLLRKMVRAGRLGRKVGRGFYTYTAPKPGS